MSTWGEKTKLVEEAATKSLIALKATSRQKKSGSHIYKKALELDPNFPEKVSEGVFKNYLSSLSRSIESRIVKDAGTYGYYLKKEEETHHEELLVTADNKEENNEKPLRRENERLLYPILETWVQSKGYRSKDTSQMKIMGKWGNPDITGVLVDEALGSFDIEIMTIEAKISSENFRYDFFEAVSHRRFANRVYFAFAATANFLRENNEELRYYSELYNVGVIVIVIEKKHFREYASGKLSEIDPDAVDVYELFSAPFEIRQRRWQKNYLKALGISDTQSLWSWGEA